MDGLASFYNKHVPVNIRTFMETLLGNSSPITEKDFSNEDLAYLKKLYEAKKQANDSHEQGLKDIKNNLKPGDWLSKENRNGVLVDTTAETLKDIDKKLSTYATTRDKTSIGYGDYASVPGADVDESDGWGKQLYGSFTDPGHRVRTTLGQFNVVEQPDGSIVVQDTYDWSKHKVSSGETSLASYLNRPEMLGNGIMRIFMPNASREVNIKLPK